LPPPPALAALVSLLLLSTTLDLLLGNTHKCKERCWKIEEHCMIKRRVHRLHTDISRHFHEFHLYI
jgi:hypothetical protein